MNHVTVQTVYIPESTIPCYICCRRHDEKYWLINQGFAGKQRLMPFFNRSNNEDLILPIQSAGISRGRNDFREDKSGEKLAESEEDLLEDRTDGSDAFNTLYIGCEKFQYREAFSLPTSGILQRNAATTKQNKSWQSPKYRMLSLSAVYDKSILKNYCAIIGRTRKFD